MSDFIVNLVTSVTNIIWSIYVLVPILVIVSLYFSFKTNFVQFRLLGHTIKNLKNNGGTESDENISSLQAFAVGLASRIGTGNLAGVATALVAGGPGAIFWMWVMALLGSVNGFVESTLAQLYKVKDHEIGYRGGPAYYMRIGLNRPGMAKLFSAILVFIFVFAICALQANTISNAVAAVLTEATGADHNMILTVVAAVLGISTAFIIFGGAKRVVDFSTVIVTVMATMYLLMTAFVMLKYFTQLDDMIKVIFDNAFNPSSIAGGTLGTVISTGFKRGLFSNEAGMGTAPNAAASADAKHPVAQGLIQALGALIDTVIICSSTAFVILLSGVPLKGSDGIVITLQALQVTTGNASTILLMFAVVFFAFSTILGIYFYGQSNYEYIFDGFKGLKVYKGFVVGSVVVGAIAGSTFVWTLGDLSSGLLALINIAAIVPLFPQVRILLKDYSEQLKSGVEQPEFDSSKYEEFKHLEIWDKSK